MIKKYLLILLCLSGISATAQFNIIIKWVPDKLSAKNDTIYYNPQHKLVWNNFQGNPDKKSPAAAVTESGFGYRMNVNAINNRVDVVINVFCYFDIRKSWVKNGMATDYALTHEQHHFDITYINACRFVQQLKQTHFTQKNFTQLVAKIHDENFEAMDKMQDAYDGETLNGRNKNIQQSWNKKIENYLAALLKD